MDGRVRTVAIIGGGPAGAQCARGLAERGLAVTLFEPRSGFEKPCGGGIPARGLDHFPFLHDPRLPGKTIRRCVVVAPSGREAEFPLHDPLYVFSRADLHTFLLERAVEAGVRLVRSRVLSFDRGRPAASSHGGGAWRLNVAGDAVRRGAGPAHGPFDFLVAADGAAGTSRRRLLIGEPSAELTQGIGYYMPGLSEDRITLKFFDDLNGYLWVFPRPDHSSAGICGTLGAQPASRLKTLMDRFLAERYGSESVARSERYAALIPGAPCSPEEGRMQGEGWALVGDSGRFVDPLTREGIYYAMLTGELLAACLAAGAPEGYATSWSRSCGGELAWAARHAAGFFEPRFVERLVALCDRSAAVGRILSDLISGKQAYRSLKRRLLLNGPWIGMEVAGRWFLRPARGS